MFSVDKIFRDDLPRRQKTLLVGVDGCGGSGKSTLANRIRDGFRDVKIVQMDDFYFKNTFDLERVKKQVLQPLSKNLTAEYQRYDWQTQTLAEWRKIEIGGTVIVEGVHSIHSKLSDFYDYKIWLDCPREIRFQRGIERDGESMREKWENDWMPAEDFYIKTDLPRERADLIIKSF